MLRSQGLQSTYLKVKKKIVGKTAIDTLEIQKMVKHYLTP